MANIKSEDLVLNIKINGSGQAVDNVNQATKSINELRKDLKLAKKALENAVPGTENFKNLQEQVNKTSARIKELSQGAEKTQSVFSKMAGGITVGGLALKGIDAIMAGVKKAFTDFTTETQQWGDLWANSMTAVSAGWHQLIANIGAGSDVIKTSVKDAIAMAYEAAQLQDELFERNNSLQIKQLKNQQEINKLQAIAMDSSKSSSERMDALDQILTLEQNFANEEKSIAAQRLEAATKNLKARTSMNEEEILQMIDLYEANRDIIIQAQEYTNEKERLNRALEHNQRLYQMVGDSVSEEIALKEAEKTKNALAQLEAKTDSTVKKFAQMNKQYNLTNDAMVTEYVESRKAMEQADVRLSEVLMSQARRRGSLTKQIAAEGTARVTKEYATALSSIESNYQKELLALKNQLMAKSITQEDYDRKSFEVEIKSLGEKIELNKKYGRDILAIENQIADKRLAAQKSVKKADITIDSVYDRYELEEKAWQENRVKVLARQAQERVDFKGSQKELELLQKQQNEELAKLDVERLKSLTDSLREILKNQGQLGIDGNAILSDEDAAKAQAKLAELLGQLDKVQSALNGTGGWKPTGKGDLFGVSQSQWQSLFDNIAQGKMGAEDMSNLLTGIGNAAQQGFAIASQAIAMTNAKENEEFKKYQKDNEQKKESLQSRLDAGLISQSQYDAQIAKLEEEEDARQEEIELKQARRAKTLAIVQASINMALAISRAFADYMWPFNIVVAGINAALGAAQIAMIASTPVSAYAEGGYVQANGKTYNAKLDPNKRGYVSSPTVLVGEEGGEYVVPADGLANPTLAPVLASIESARRSGTLKSLDFGAVGARTMSGFVDGGATTQKSDATSMYIGSSNREIMEMLISIRNRMDNPVPAQVNFLGTGGIKEAQDKYNRYKEKGILR